MFACMSVRPKKVMLATRVSEESFLFLGAGNNDTVGQKTRQPNTLRETLQTKKF